VNKISQQSVDYDVTIVGGGPGGSTAGYLLKRLGLKVQIIDKDVFPRQKLCGGILTFKTFKLLKRVFGETVESLLDKHIINYTTNHFEINYKVKRIMSNNISQFPFYLVDRIVYDNFLLDKAKEIGVDVIEGDKVEKVNLNTYEISSGNVRIVVIALNRTKTLFKIIGCHNNHDSPSTYSIYGFKFNNL